MPVCDYWKNTALTIQNLLGKVMSLLFKMLSRLVISFLQKSKYHGYSNHQQWFLEPNKIRSLIVSIISPSICHEVLGTDAMILVFRTLSFKPVFHSPLWLSSRGSFIPLHFPPLAYLRLLVILPAILTPTCASSSPAFRMMYFAYKLNIQGDNIQLWHTPLPIWNQSIVPCPVLTVAFWPAYKFLRREVKWTWLSCLTVCHPMDYTVHGILQARI